MRALQVRDDPAVEPADDLMRDLDMPRRHPSVHRKPQGPLGPTDQEPRLANPDDLAVDPAVVEHRQDRRRRPRRRPIRHCRPPQIRRRLHRRIRTPTLQVGQQRLADVVVGFEHRAGVLGRRDWLVRVCSPSHRLALRRMDLKNSMTFGLPGPSIDARKGNLSRDKSGQPPLAIKLRILTLPENTKTPTAPVTGMFISP